MSIVLTTDSIWSGKPQKKVLYFSGSAAKRGGGLATKKKILLLKLEKKIQKKM